MKKAVLIGWLVLWGTLAIAASPLSNPEKHRLAAYLSYITVTAPKSPVDESYKAGDICGACGGRGSVGDGVIESPCDFVTPDGLLACKGTGKLQSTGGMMDYEIDETLCEPTPERDELFEAIENAPLDFNESTVRELEYDLEQALEEVQTLKATCPNCPSCPPQKQTADQPETTVEEPSCDVLTIYKMPGATWNWNGRRNPSTEYMRSHISQEHGIDASGMSRDQLQIVHNNAHNYGDDMALGTATYEAKSSGTSSSSCPGGNCPTSGSSRSRGFFGRWR